MKDRGSYPTISPSPEGGGSHDLVDGFGQLGEAVGQAVVGQGDGLLLARRGAGW